MLAWNDTVVPGVSAVTRPVGAPRRGKLLKQTFPGVISLNDCPCKSKVCCLSVLVGVGVGECG